MRSIPVYLPCWATCPKCNEIVRVTEEYMKPNDVVRCMTCSGPLEVIGSTDASKALQAGLIN